MYVPAETQLYEIGITGTAFLQQSARLMSLPHRKRRYTRAQKEEPCVACLGESSEMDLSSRKNATGCQMAWDHQQLARPIEEEL
jgi:hypothetical protein